jgi:hypothetical protein
MIAPTHIHYMAAKAIHAEHLANATRSRLAGKQLQPHAGRPRVQLQRRQVAAALASVVMAVVLATAVSAAVNTNEPATSAPNGAADSAGGGGGGGRVLHQ